MAFVALIGCVFVLGGPSAQTGGTFDVRGFGARGDGITKDTAAIQSAIDAADKAGGGTVVFPAGRYLSGTLHLKNNLTIQLSPGAILAASTDRADFDPYEKLAYESHADKETTYSHFALLAGDGVHDVSIVGGGVIDGNRTKRGGPKPVAFKNCEQVTIRDVTIRNGPNYCLSFLGCDHIVIDNARILNGYADGIDPDCCRYVRISNCYVESSDDAICLKASLALGARRSTEHVTVTNCVLTSSSNNFKMGTESSGDFKDVAVSNCAMYKRENARDSSGVAIESVDGSNIEGVAVSNIVMQNVHNPLFIRLGNRGRGLSPPVPGSLRHVSVSSVVATGSDMTVSINGVPGHPVEDVHLDGLRLTMAGGEQSANGLDVPELPEKYPECNMFGTLPSYGVYARHVDGLSITKMRLGWVKSDIRPAAIFDDVSGLDIDGLQIENAESSGPAVWLNDTSKALMRGIRLAAGAPIGVRVSGKKTSHLVITSSDLSVTRRPVEVMAAVKMSEVTIK